MDVGGEARLLSGPPGRAMAIAIRSTRELARSQRGRRRWSSGRPTASSVRSPQRRAQERGVGPRRPPVLGVALDRVVDDDRVAAGEAQLLQHTLEGLNAMPPLGYCMDCTEADFRALIRFMIPAELKTTETDT